MAVATAPSTETKSSSPLPLWLASLAGGVFVLAALAVVFYLVPQVWVASLGKPIRDAAGSFVNFALLLTAQVAAAVGLGVVGSALGGSHPQTGIRGGIFLAISAIFTVFFLSRAVGMWAMSWFGVPKEAALVAFGVAAAGFGFLALLFLRGKTFRDWAVGLHEGGWLSLGSYKKNQGQKVRRLTILGILLIFASGIYTLVSNQHLSGVGDWVVHAPFLPNITLLPDIEFTVPALLVGLALWIGYRAVNYPVFADFLIATEAEMNKVSWSPRYRLIQDTIVVLVTLVLMTVFLFVVDIFWGWLLSRNIVGVLPKTQYKYTLLLDEVNPDKKEEILKALGGGVNELDAKRIFESAPNGSGDAKLAPQVVGSGLSEEAAEKLSRELKKVGAKVTLTQSKANQTTKLEW